MAKSLDKRVYKNYLLKSEEMLAVAKHATETSKNNASVVASIHCAINALDALAIFYFGRRHSGNHKESLIAIKGAMSESEFEDMAKQFGGLMELKNRAEYQPDLMGARDASDAVQRASRIISKVKQKLPPT